MTTSNEGSPMVPESMPAEPYDPNKSAQAAVDAANEETARVKRLLLGACRLITDLEAVEQMGPELLAWWMSNPEYADEAARRVISSLPDKDLALLRGYMTRHGDLPTKGKGRPTTV